VASSFSFEQLERMAIAIAASKLFGVTTKEGALSLMLLAQAEGRHPAIAIRDYHIIEGRPALKADAMLARFQAAGGTLEWHELSDTRVAATFSHPACQGVRIDWTMARALQAGLADKSTWKKYPRAMLRSRVISEGVRTCLPGVIVGTYTPEELEDGAPGVPTAAFDRTTGEIIDATVESAPPQREAPKLAESELADHLAAIAAASTPEDLQRVHALAYRRAYDADDLVALKRFDAAKREAKQRMISPAAAP